MAKQEVCCARWTSRLHTAERDLAVVARKASHAVTLGRSTAKFQQQIAELKATIERYKQDIVDHEAEHALCADVPCTDRNHYELRA